MDSAMKRVSDNLQAHTIGKCTVSARRILLTKWIGAAWEEISEDQAMIIKDICVCRWI